MDYFGEIVDELTELQERIEASGHAEDAIPVLKAVRRAMYAALYVERRRSLFSNAGSILQQDAIAQLAEDNEESRRAA